MLKLLNNKKLQKYIASFLFIVNLFLILPNYSYANKDKTMKIKEGLEVEEIEDIFPNDLGEDKDKELDKTIILNHVFKVNNVDFIENMPDYMYNAVVDKAHKDILNILKSELRQEEVEEAIVEILKKGIENYKRNEQEKLDFMKEKERRDAFIVSKNKVRSFISPSPRMNSEIKLLDSFDGNKELGTIQATGGFVAVSDINKAIKNYSVDFSKHEIDTFIDVRNTGGALYLIPDYVEFDIEYVIPFQLDIDKKLAIPEKKTYHRKALVKHNMQTSTDIFKGEGFDRYIGAPSNMANSDLDLDRILNRLSWKSLKLEDDFYSDATGVLKKSNFTIDDLKDKSKRKVKIEIRSENLYRSNITIDLKAKSSILGKMHLAQPTFKVDSNGNLIGEEVELALSMDNGYKDLMIIDEDSEYIDRAVNIVSGEEVIGRKFYLNKEAYSGLFDEFKIKGNEKNSIVLTHQTLSLNVELTEKGEDLFSPKLVFYDYETGEILDYLDTELVSRGFTLNVKVKEGQKTDLSKDWKTVDPKDDRFFEEDVEFKYFDDSIERKEFVYSRANLLATSIWGRTKKVPLVPKRPADMKKYKIKTYSNNISHRDLAFRPVGARNQNAKNKVNAYFDYEIRRPANETEHKILAMSVFDLDFIENNKGVDALINEHFPLRATRTFGSVASTLEDVNYDDSIILNKNSKYATIRPGNKKELKIFATGKKFSDVFGRYYLNNINTNNGIRERTSTFKRQEKVENSNERLYTPGVVLELDDLRGEEVYDHRVLFVHDKEADKKLYKENKITGQHFHVSNIGTSDDGLRSKYTPAFDIYTRNGKYTNFVVEIYNNKNGKLLKRVNINNVSHDTIDPTLKSAVMGFKQGYKFSHHDYPNKDITDISSSGDEAVIKTYYDPNRIKVKLEHYDTIEKKVIGEEHFLAYVGDEYTPKEFDYDKERLEREDTITIPPMDESDDSQVVRFNYTPKEETFEIHYKDLDDNNKILKKSTFKERYNNPVGDIEITPPKGYDVKNIVKPTTLLNKNDKVIVELERSPKVYKIIAKDSETEEVLYKDEIEHKMISEFEYHPRELEGYNKKSADSIIVKEGSDVSYEASSEYTLYYTKKRYSIKVDYLTKDGKKIKDSDIYEAKYKDTFNLKAKDLPLVSNPSPKELNISEVKDNANLEFIYEAQDVDIKINYIDQNGRKVKTENFKEKAYNSFSQDISNVGGLDKYELANKDKTTINVGRLEKPSYSFDVDIVLNSFDLIIEGISGTKYRIYDEDNNKEIILETKEDGKVVKNLPVSNYKVEQIYAPEGYRLNKNTEIVSLDDINKSDGSITVEYKQYEASPIPDTGTLGKLPFYVLGALLGVVSVVFRKRNFVK